MDFDYYIVVQEWLYPTESGRDVYDDTFDTKEDALAMCVKLCEDEETNFAENIGGDALPTERTMTDGEEDGAIVSSKMGLDDFFFRCRVIHIVG